MKTEAEAIAELTERALTGAEILRTEAGREILVIGNQHVDVTEPNAIARTLPDHIGQNIVLQTVDSLVDYVNHYKDGGGRTVLFADISLNKVVAVVDYHKADGPAHGAHRANMDLPFAEEWKAWTKASGVMVGQLEFARFIEENAADVEQPSGADLLDVVRDLHAVRKVDFKKAVRTSSDNENFEYTDETQTSTRQGSVEVPTKFRLRLPVYFNAEPVELWAFLRWKLDDGKLQLGIVLHRAEHVRQAEFKRIVTDAAVRTSCPAVFGRPL